MRYLIVDCHSVIFSWPELQKLHRRSQRLAREELVKRLTQYQDGGEVRVVAVFDGRGERFNDASEPGGIQVLYAGADQTADDLIERLAARYAQEHELTVATNDYLEQQTVETFGAFSISTETLWARLEEARGEFERRLKQVRKSAR